MVVTGVSRRSGIGFAVACRLAAYGAHVLCHHYAPHDAQQPWGSDEIDAVLDGVRAHAIDGGRVEGIHADLTAAGAPESVIERAVAEFGRIDVLVCNQALSGSDGPIGTLTSEMLDRHWAVNARASILLAQAFAEHHTDGDDGSIVFLTSGQGMGPMPGEIAYATSKAALAGITASIADGLADRRIRVNTVNPGPVDTGYFTDEIREYVAPRFPGGRSAVPDDPARLIAWLATGEASWVTGQVINSEGGFRRA